MISVNRKICNSRFSFNRKYLCGHQPSTANASQISFCVGNICTENVISFDGILCNNKAMYCYGIKIWLNAIELIFTLSNCINCNWCKNNTNKILFHGKYGMNYLYIISTKYNQDTNKQRFDAVYSTIFLRIMFLF